MPESNVTPLAQNIAEEIESKAFASTWSGGSFCASTAAQIISKAIEPLERRAERLEKCAEELENSIGVLECCVKSPANEEGMVDAQIADSKQSLHALKEGGGS
jgi:hypothetical protein